MSHFRILLASALLLAGSGVAEPAAAMSVPPEVYSIYGPMTQCIDGYKFEASALEAVTHHPGVWLTNSSASLTNDDYRLALSWDRPPLHPSRVRVTEFGTHHLGTVQRLHLQRERGMRGYSTDIPEHFEYRLPAIDGGHPIRVWSNRFDGSARDLEILGRISRVDPTSDRCGQFAPPDFRGADPDARIWSRMFHHDRRFHCQAHIGFALVEGESLQRPWPIDGSFRFWSRVVSGESRLTLRTPQIAPPRRRRPRTTVNAGHAGQVRQIYGGRTILVLGPPDPFSRRLTADERYLQQVFIEYEPGAEASARALAGRLEFIEPNDPRCA